MSKAVKKVPVVGPLLAPPDLPDPPSPPPEPEPMPIADTDDDQARARRRRAIATQLQGGRSSAIFGTGGGGTLGPSG